jgi:hypothetical protein
MHNGLFDALFRFIPLGLQIVERPDKLIPLQWNIKRESQFSKATRIIWGVHEKRSP